MPMTGLIALTVFIIVVALVLLTKYHYKLKYLSKKLDMAVEKGIDVSYAPTKALFKIANQERLRKIKGTDRYRDVLEEIKDGTTKTPLLIIVDANGKVALKDGHHRLLAAQSLGFEYLPVVFRNSKRITSHGAHIQDALPTLLHRP